MNFNKVVLLIAMFIASVAAAQSAPVNITSFGAVGNGINDNLTAIQSAINSVASTGGTVYVPEGYFNVSGTLRIPSNVRIQGMGSYFNCQLRLTNVGVPLFEVGDGASNVIFKDLTLLAIPNGIWRRSSREEVELIRSEGTIGIAMNAGTFGISGITTEGISAGSLLRNNTSASVSNVKIRNYASDGNEYAIHTNTTGADLWDVQNLDVFNMYYEQNGIFLERSGRMSFLQLNCAGSEGGVCAKLWGNGDTYFRNMHTEGARLGFCVGSHCDGSTGNTGENSSVITVENSPAGGHFYRATNLVSVNNRFWLDFPQNVPVLDTRPYHFFGTGANSWVMSCADVWVSWSPSTHMTNTTVIPPSTPFPGLATIPVGCLSAYYATVPIFVQGYVADNERLSREVDVTAPPYNAVPNDNADDTAAFVAALNAANNTAAGAPRKRVFVPAGTFDVGATLELVGGETFLGVEGSVIRLNGEDRALFKVAAVTVPDVVRGITFRNLKLTAKSKVGTKGIALENSSPTQAGGAVDFQIQGVDFEGFDIGLAVYPEGGDLANANPMYDSISLKNAEFVNNNIGLLVRSQNASNWNVENIKAVIPNNGEGVRIDGPGNFSIRDIACSSPGTGAACVNVQRQNGLIIEGLTATNVQYALMVRWENGWTQFPFTLRNSNLLAGVYFQGRVYLSSVNNTYPARIGRGVAPTNVRFAALYEGDSQNIAPGEMSDIFSCNDTFIDLSTMQTSSFWFYTGNLNKPVNYCN